MTKPDTGSPLAIGGWDVLLALFVAVALGVVTVAVSFGVAMLFFDDVALPHPGDKMPQPIVYFGLLLEAGILVGGVAALRLRRPDFSWRRFGLRPVSGRWIWTGVGLGLVCVPLVILLVGGLKEILDLPSESPQLPFLAPGGFSWMTLAIVLLLGGGLVPFAEEIFFRGLVYGWLRRVWGIPAGVVVSALLFGVIHGFLVVAVAATLVGAVLALVYEKSRSLWPPMVLHMAFNSASLGLMFLELAAKPGAAV